MAAGAALVRAVLDGSREAPLDEGSERARAWETDASAIIEEHRRLQHPHITVNLSSELTVTDLVSLSQDEKRFATTFQRPLPFKPNPSARRGSAFHSWIEEYFAGGEAAPALFDYEEMKELSDEPSNGTASGALPEQAAQEARKELAELKRTFLRSEWAARTPRYVEYPFQLVLGGHTLRGRMDAVFHDAASDTWTIVDWKTGAPPPPKEWESPALQLATYREALIEGLKARGTTPAAVRAAFFYLQNGETAYLPEDRDWRATLLRQLELEGSGVTPGR